MVAAGGLIAVAVVAEIAGGSNVAEAAVVDAVAVASLVGVRHGACCSGTIVA